MRRPRRSRYLQQGFGPASLPGSSFAPPSARWTGKEHLSVTVIQEGTVRRRPPYDADRADERVRQQGHGEDLVAHLDDLPRDGRTYDRRARRPQARARVHLRDDGRPQARRVRPHPDIPRPCGQRQGENAVSTDHRQAPEGGWGELTVDELKSELEARGLTKSGKKDELIARLEEDDAAPAAVAEGETPEPDSEEAQEASEDAAAAADADEAGAEGAGEEAAAEQPRRRGSVETSTGATRKERAPGPEGDLIVRARAKYVRSAPRKARLVM